MSLFSCLDNISHLKNNYPQLTDYLSHLEEQIKQIDLNNQPHKISTLVVEIKQQFPKVANLQFYSPALWLPINNFDFPQKLTAIINELSECEKLSRQPKLSPISSFQLPNIKPPLFSNNKFKELYKQLYKKLDSFKNINDAAYIHQHWLEFDAQTTLHKQNFKLKKNSMWQRYQQHKYLSLRQGIQNQMALAYMFNKNKQADINSQTDWHKGSSKQTGYGYVMALAKHNFNPSLEQQTHYYMNKDICDMGSARNDINKDQKDIKHNRITPLKIATTHTRAKAILELAKKNPSQHLQIKLQGRINSESYSYLQYESNSQDCKIFFCEPKYGLFKFNNESDFLFFYQMLYAKQEIQNKICWNRYQVSAMQYAPNQKPSFSWKGKLRSLLYGLKYNNNIIGMVKGFVLFNLSLFVSVLAIQLIASALAIISVSLSATLLQLLANSGFSLLLSASFAFASAGLLSLPDLCQTLWHTGLDYIKPLFGAKSHFDEILHKDFGCLNINAETKTSHQHLINALEVKESQSKDLGLEIEPKQPNSYELDPVTPAPEFENHGLF